MVEAGARSLRDSHDWVSPQEADVLVVLGGDGFLLHVLHEMLDWEFLKPVYGMNLGTVGFLMNGQQDHVPVAQRIAEAHRVPVRPLCMHATNQNGEEFSYYAINEVSLLREPRQTAKLEVRINGRVRMLAMTPLSPFRPRRWKGAILPESAEVEFRIREPGKRPVAAVADQKEVRDVATVRIAATAERELTLLFDPGFTLEERIFAEQFQV